MNYILIIEDDKHLGPTIQKGLEEQGFTASLSLNGKNALAMIQKKTPDLIILDLGLPDYDGIDLLKIIHKHNHNHLILILTARYGLTDKVEGLDKGADDYLVKPFAFTELVARIRALLRRAPEAVRKIKAGDISIDLVTRHINKNGKVIDLTPLEFDIISYLAYHSNQVVSRQILAEQIWREPFRFTSLDNVIDVHVSHLRRKLTNDSGSCPLRVVRGYGILLESS